MDGIEGTSMNVLFSRLKSFIRDHWKLLLAIASISVILLAWGLYLRSRGLIWADWTGFGNYSGTLPKDDRGKTLWEWMGLLLVPIGLGVGAGLWSYIQQKAEGERVLNQQHEDALRTYFDKIGQLLMEKELLKTKDAAVNTKEAAIRN